VLFFLVSCTKLAFAWGKRWSGDSGSGDTHGVGREFWQPDLVSIARQQVQGDKAVGGAGRFCGRVQGAMVVTGAPAPLTGRGKIQQGGIGGKPALQKLSSTQETIIGNNVYVTTRIKKTKNAITCE